ncbi:MAG: dipeptidase [Deltaproteobacteria bacterium]|nr:dipeptidase [Deltaproteobacteria bacterium]MBW2385492.1 dipeptidase [Deltaproteobacteria bacterium]
MRSVLRWSVWLLGGIAAVVVARGLLGTVLVSLRPRPDPPDAALAAHAAQLHRDALLLDGHNDVPTWMLRYGFDLAMDGNEPSDRNPFFYYPFEALPFAPTAESIHTHTDLARLREGGVDAQFFSIFVDCAVLEEGAGAAKRRALEMIAAFHEQLSRHGDRIELSRSRADVDRIRHAGKIAALMGLEGGHAIEDDLTALGEFHALGIRYVTLTHNCTHGWADAAGDADDPDVNRHGGLSEFGRGVVREMNQLGLIVDVSHAADDTFWDVIETTRAPIMASHSSVRSIADQPRNLSDEMLRALADNGGIAMINFRTVYLDPEKTAIWKLLTGWHWLTHPGGTGTPLSAVADHIDRAVQVAGLDHVGLGSDFDGVMLLPDGLADVGDFPNLTLELVRRGYSDEAVAKILGGNALRVLERVEQIASPVAD